MSRHWSRRQWLAAAATLGGSVFLGGWGLTRWLRRTGPAYTVIADNPNHELGHKLRQKWQPPAPTQTRQVGIVIVGGGMSGLSAAWWLQRNGYQDFELLELEQTLGGNSSGGHNDVSAYPWAAHYVPVLNPETEYAHLLFRELGLITGTDEAGMPIYDELALVHDPEERLFHHGRWVEGLVPRLGLSPEATAQHARFFAQMEAFRNLRINGKSAFAIPHHLSGWNDELRALEAEPFASWLDRQGYTDRDLRWYLSYCTRDDYGLTPEMTSAWAGIHYFAARRGEAANADSGAVLTWPNGNQHLVQLLTSHLGSRVRTRQLVAQIAQPTTATAPLHLTTYDAGSDTTEQLTAKAVILATPLHVSARLAPWLQLDAKAVTHTPWVVCNVTVQGVPEALGVPLAWDNVSRHSTSLGYIHAKHQSLSRQKAETVLTWYLPLTDTDATTARRNAYQQPPEHWADLCVRDLNRMHPGIAEWVREVQVRVWGHGMVGPTPGLLHSAALRHAQQPHAGGRLHLAHTDLAGISIFEEAQAQGVRAAQAVLRHLQHLTT